MKAALWETSAGALAALLNSGQPLNMADLYTLTLADGTVYRWSGDDVAVQGNGQTWALGPGLKRTRTRFAVGIEVDQITVSVVDIMATTFNGQALIPYIRQGGFTEAWLQLDRAYWGAADTAPVGALKWFVGRMANIAYIDRTRADLVFKSPLEMLDAMVPREVYQAGCANTVFDAQCGASKAAFTFTGTVVGGTSATRLTFTASLGKATGYFDLGVVTMTSGAAAGARQRQAKDQPRAGACAGGQRRGAEERAAGLRRAQAARAVGAAGAARASRAGRGARAAAVHVRLAAIRHAVGAVTRRAGRRGRGGAILAHATEAVRAHAARGAGRAADAAAPTVDLCLETAHCRIKAAALPRHGARP